MTLVLRVSIPGEQQQSFELTQPTMVIGRLPSNPIILHAPGVDPIHALLELDEQGQWRLTDLGSETGVRVNGQSIEVETKVQPSDRIEIGEAVLVIEEVVEQAAALPPPPATMVSPQGAAGDLPQPPAVQGGGQGESTRVASGAPPHTVQASQRHPASQSHQAASAAAPRTHVPTQLSTDHPRATSSRSSSRRSSSKSSSSDTRRREVLFSPRKARPGGDVLEVVAYWGDTVLDVNLFEMGKTQNPVITIGDPTKADFIAAGKGSPSVHPLAQVRSSGYKVRMLEGMSCRLRKGGQVEKLEGAHKISLGKRDIAHITYGPVRYFLIFVRPPVLNIPKRKINDPLFAGLMMLGLLLNLVLIPLILMTEPAKKEDKKDDIWSIVRAPEKEKPKIAQAKKPKVELKKIEPKKPKPPPPPKPKPFKPKPPEKVVKVEKPKPVKKPKPKPPMKVAKAPPKPPAPKAAKPPTPTPPAPKAPAKKPGRSAPSTGALKPDNKLAGARNKNRRLGKAGGAKGSGLKQKGGARKGKSRVSAKGVEGVKNTKPSGPNLNKLGQGIGNILAKKGPGAISTNFRSSAGGAGGGSGSASKTYGLGGIGKAKSVGVAGAGGSVNNFGSGSGGLLSGQGGSGGAGGGGIGNTFGGGRGGSRANISVPSQDVVQGGGLSSQEVMAVIRANLNQVRHCYEQVLQRQPNLSGTVKVRFQIALNGRAQGVKVLSSSIRNANMQSCITSRVRRWKFPRPRGGQPVTVDFPFSFTPI